MVKILNPPKTPTEVIIFGRVSDVEPVSKKKTFRTVETTHPDGTAIGIERDIDRHDFMPHKGRKFPQSGGVTRSVVCAMNSGGFSPKELIKKALGGK